MENAVPLELDYKNQQILILIAKEGRLTSKDLVRRMNQKHPKLLTQINTLRRLIEMVENGYLDLESSNNAPGYFSLRKNLFK